MTLIFNMDLDNLTKVTNYGFQITRTPPTFYFRLYQNGYDVDMSKFNSLTLRIRTKSTNQINTVTITKVVTINNEKLVEVTLNSNYFVKSDTIILSPTVRFSNKSLILKDFEFIIYEGSKTEMTMVKTALERFNHMYNLYIKAIKRDQINKPLGVVGLDGKAKIPIERLPDFISKHPQEMIRNGEIHGLKLDEDFMLLYYDSMDDEFYIANSVYGGRFTHPNKPSPKYDYFGGHWGSMDVIAVDSSTFDVDIADAFDGGNFNDNPDDLGNVHGGRFK